MNPAIYSHVSFSSYQQWSTPDAAFQYTRLSTEPGTAYIRFLDLEEGSRGSIIKCHLRDVDINAKSILPYEAVSYSWGKDILHGHVNYVLSIAPPNCFSEYQTEEQDVGNRFILCNGKALRIQHNLYDLLVRLREKRRERSP